MFDVDLLIEQKIALTFASEDEYDGFLEVLRECWPDYYSVPPWGNEYQYVIGYHGTMKLQYSNQSTYLPSKGYEIVPYSVFLGRGTGFDSLASVSSLYE